MRSVCCLSTWRNNGVWTVNWEFICPIVGWTQELEQCLQWHTVNRYCYCITDFSKCISSVQIPFNTYCAFYGYIQLIFKTFFSQGNTQICLKNSKYSTVQYIQYIHKVHCGIKWSLKWMKVYWEHNGFTEWSAGLQYTVSYKSGP
jgi:hypothetical protein